MRLVLQTLVHEFDLRGMFLDLHKSAEYLVSNGYDVTLSERASWFLHVKGYLGMSLCFTKNGKLVIKDSKHFGKKKLIEKLVEEFFDRELKQFVVSKKVKQIRVE